MKTRGSKNSPFRYVTSQGTFSALRDLLGRISLPMNIHDELHLPGVGTWAFLLRPKTEIRLVLTYFWLRRVSWSIDRDSKAQLTTSFAHGLFIKPP